MKKESWDYFYKTNQPEKQVFVSNTQKKPSGNYIYVSASSFNGFTTSLKGGCIFVDSQQVDTLVESSSFTNVQSSNFATTLYFSVKNIIYNKIIISLCISTTNHDWIFDYAITPDSIL